MRDLEVLSFICSAVSPLLPPPTHVFSFTKCLPPMWETWVRSLGREDPLEKEMVTHWPTPVFLPGESHRQRSLVGFSTGSQRVGHDWASSLSLFTFTLSTSTCWASTPCLAVLLLQNPWAFSAVRNVGMRKTVQGHWQWTQWADCNKMETSGI